MTNPTDKPMRRKGYMPFEFGGWGAVRGTVMANETLVVVTDTGVYTVRGGETDDPNDQPHIRMLGPL